MPCPVQADPIHEISRRANLEETEVAYIPPEFFLYQGAMGAFPPSHLGFNALWYAGMASQEERVSVSGGGTLLSILVIGFLASLAYCISAVST